MLARFCSSGGKYLVTSASKIRKLKHGKSLSIPFYQLQAKKRFLILKLRIYAFFTFSHEISLVFSPIAIPAIKALGSQFIILCESLTVRTTITIVLTNG